jgi:hypothetical protein
MNRKQAIARIKKAYENEELGMQKGMYHCRYYCHTTDSHCAVGILIGKKKGLIDRYGDIEVPFKGTISAAIKKAMYDLNKNTFCGLSVEELQNLQELHDESCQCGDEVKQDYMNRFKTYLYSL